MNAFSLLQLSVAYNTVQKATCDLYRRTRHKDRKIDFERVSGSLTRALRVMKINRLEELLGKGE